MKTQYQKPMSKECSRYCKLFVAVIAGTMAAIFLFIYNRSEGYIMEVTTWRARTNKGLTLVQLSKLTGISKTTLNDIENGKTSPTLQQLEYIAIALDMKITDLFESDRK